MKTSQDNRSEALRELYLTAERYLAKPHEVPKAQSLAGWHLQLRLWHIPTFSAARAWGIYQKRERGVREARTLVRQITWDQINDWGRLSDPRRGLAEGFHSHPTIEVRDRSIDTRDYDSRFATLTTISFPAFSERGIGIDGEQFGIAYPQPGASVEWWCEGPESWRNLTAWAAEVRGWLVETTAAPPRPEVKIPFRPKLP